MNQNQTITVSETQKTDAKNCTLIVAETWQAEAENYYLDVVNTVDAACGFFLFTVRQDMDVNIGGKSFEQVRAEKDIVAGGKITVESKRMLELKCGSSSIRMTHGMITIRANMVRIN